MRIVVLLAVLLCAIAEADSVAGLGGTTVNSNPSFEQMQGDGSLVGWETPERAGTQWAPTSKATHEGDRALVLEGAGLAKGYWISLLSEPFDIALGDVLNLEMWGKSSGKPSDYLWAMIEVRRNGAWEALPGRISAGEAKDWRHFALTGETVNRETDAARVLVRARTNMPKGTAWFVDDVRCAVTSLRDYANTNRDAERLPNIALIVADALTPAVLGCYPGNARNATPNIDHLAKGGWVYENTATAAPWTRPSFASLWTSLYPSQHGADDRNLGLSESYQTLPELLKERGYFTAGFAFTAPDGFLGSYMGFGQGFDVYFQSRDEDQVATALKSFLDNNAETLRTMAGGGLFIFFHPFFPHSPHKRYAPHLVRNPEGILGDVEINSLDHLSPINHGEMVFGEDYNAADVDYIRALYDWEAIYTDSLVGDLMARLKWLGLEENMNVVFTADHGESFDDKGEWGHGHGYETTTAIPLILRFPDHTQPDGRKTGLVSNLDIMPTLLDLAGMEQPENIEGISLLQNKEHGFLFSESRRYGWLTLRKGPYKLVLSEASKFKHGVPRWTFLEEGKAKYELYNLALDPQEQHDLAEKEPETLAELKTVLLDHCKRITLLEPKTHSDETAISADTLRQLKSLGYL